MNSLILLLMMQVATTQFLVSTKAGLVNYVQGKANIEPAKSVPVGEPVITGAGGAVEILLNPGSYLRMGENSRVVLEKVDLSDIAVRILEGSMIVTANGVDKDLPIRVATGSLNIDLIKDGIYLFADGKVIVVDGKVRDGANSLVYGKGYEISNDQGYRARKVKTFTTGLELWSQKRDEEIAKANLNVARSLQRSTVDLPLSSLLDVWLWYPGSRYFIYMPGARYRSPYGYNYLPAAEIYRPNGGYAENGNGGGFRGGSNGGGSNNAGGGSAAASSGGGGGIPGSPGAPVAGGREVGPSPGAQGPHQGAPARSVAP